MLPRDATTEAEHLMWAAGEPDGLLPRRSGADDVDRAACPTADRGRCSRSIRTLPTGDRAVWTRAVNSAWRVCEVGALMAATDWPNSALGPVER